MVVVIIGILAALLLPVIGRALRKGKITQVNSDIHLLDAALTEFKSKYGVFPPSRICLHENPVAFAYGQHTGPLAQVLNATDQRTLVFLKRMFPNFNPTNPASVGLNVYDYNGNGQADNFLTLNGAECLVFFLGGMPQPLMPDVTGGENLVGLLNGTLAQVTTRGVEGFSQNPQLPFGRSAVDTATNGNAAIAVGATQRTASLFEFNPGRLTDLDFDGFWEYYDPATQPPTSSGTFDPDTMPHPYAYFSGYEGQGYNWLALPNALPIPTYDNAWFDAMGNPRGLLWAFSRNATQVPSQVQWWNKQSYQIVAPGINDGLIGHGLITDGNNVPNALVILNPGSTGYDIDQMLSPEMHDDITNFSGGQLEDME